MKRRVAVTGLGVVSPIGLSVPEFRENLMAGVSGVGPVTLFDADMLPTRIAAEVALHAADLEYRDRKVDFALRAAAEALRDAGIEKGGPGAGLAIALGLELFSLDDLAALSRIGFELPTAARDRMTFLQTPSDLCIPLLARRFHFPEPPMTLISACAAGTDALGTGFSMVRDGRRDLVLAGGADSMINPPGLGGFSKIMATSVRNDPPADASCPFDLRRDGFVLGEGAAMLVLEPFEAARARGATIHAEIKGYATSFDADRISRPHPEGDGALRAMRGALADAGIGPDRIDAVNAHGTSTPLNDKVETLALKRLLGDRAHEVPVSAAKSMFGHLIAAAGAVEAVAAILGLKSGRVHPTINLEEPDPECDLDYVTEGARPHEQEFVLSNSFGFGGQNACVVLRRADGPR